MRSQEFKTRPGKSAFTLIELLVVIAIIAILAAMILPALTRSRQSAKSAQCGQQLRQIALAVRLYADANADELPRSQHSAIANGQWPWGRAISPELGQNPVHWTNLLAGVYHCPEDKRQLAWSYGQSVYFELNPKSDDYVGAPQTWRRVSQIPRPTATILHGENASDADHIMPHFWTSARDVVDLATNRHGKASYYGFVDGHAEKRMLNRMFDPEHSVDAWNPSLAR